MFYAFVRNIYSCILKNVALVRNPFLYKSKVQDFKDPSQLYDSSVSKYSAAITLDYFDDEGTKLIITDTLSPVWHLWFFLFIKNLVLLT